MWQAQIQPPAAPLAPPHAVPQAVGDDARRRYDEIAAAQKYTHFTKIPERIVRCLERFGVPFNRESVRRRLMAHYLFIGVVDDAIDSGQSEVADVIFDRLLNPIPDLSPCATRSDVELVTEILKSHIDQEVYPLMVTALQRAHDAVINERTASSIDSYIEHRKALGRSTAEQSYLLVRSALTGPEEKLCQIMKDIGAVGCLVDSIIDLRDDSRSGLLTFKPAVSDVAKLCFCTLGEGLRVWFRKPSLTLLFVEAIIDNIRDRKRGLATRDQFSISIKREDEAAGVA